MKSARLDPDALIDKALETVRYHTGWTRQQAAILLGALLVIGLIFFCALTGVIGSTLGQPTATPTAVPLANRSAADVLGYLKAMPVTLSAVQTLAVPNATWQAAQGAQFTAQVGAKSGAVTLLSYASVGSAGVDAFKATNAAAFSGWAIVQLANVLLISPSGTDADVLNALESHLTTYLLAPYRAYLPTATPAH